MVSRLFQVIRQHLNSRLSAFGCTLKVDLSSDPDQSDIREYAVPAEYRTKADARAAVLCVATQEGLIELLSLPGQEPPAGRFSDLAAQLRGLMGERQLAKRKLSDDTHSAQIPAAKKQKTAHSDSGRQGEIRVSSHRAVKPNNKPWKKSHGPGSNGLVSLDGPGQPGSSTSQHHVPRNVGYSSVASGSRSSLHYGQAGSDQYPLFSPSGVYLRIHHDRSLN